VRELVCIVTLLEGLKLTRLFQSLPIILHYWHKELKVVKLQITSELRATSNFFIENLNAQIDDVLTQAWASSSSSGKSRVADDDVSGRRH